MVDLLFHTFNSPEIDARLQWLNPPSKWAVDPLTGSLRLEPAPHTDFWQKTHYGFEVDNGHFLFAETIGDVVITTRFHSYPVHQYDQAGLMVRFSPECWIKASAEYEPDGPSQLGAVVTQYGYSDWSLQPLAPGRNQLWLRIRREGDDYLIEHSENGEAWILMRLAHLAPVDGASLACGLYACSPKGAGYRAEFDFLRIERPD